jgi:hypothetical protein
VRSRRLRERKREERDEESERMRRSRGSLLSFPLWKDRFPPAFDKGRKKGDSLESLEEFMRMGNEMRKDELREETGRMICSLLPLSSLVLSLFLSLLLCPLFSHSHRMESRKRSRRRDREEEKKER